MAFAERHLDVIDASLTRGSATFRLHAPVRIEADHWMCALDCEGNISKRFKGQHQIHGIDGWQALDLAKGLALAAIEFEMCQGARFLWPGTDDEFDPQLMISGAESPS
ncbi:hypothetical protein [Lysobacter brunescens]|uniref:DUF2442 domain-containing protein n=1 Tax=Lysobacter brunescens TaxID=262323 RepID=A0ABW2YB65_9GAMM